MNRADCDEAPLRTRQHHVKRRHVRGFREVVKRALIQGVFEHDETFFEDGITRRSAKLAQRAFAPALASRGAPRDLASQTKH